MSTPQIPTPIKLQKGFKRFKKQIRDVWESYNLVDQYMQHVHEGLKSATAPTFSLQGLTGGNIRQYDKLNTFGAIDHLRRQANPRRTLIDAMASFEDYLAWLVFIIYRDYPQKLLSVDSGSAPEYEAKLLKIVVESQTRSDILERIAEERIRGLFYGNPVDFFLKDRAKLEFGTYFKQECKAEMDAFAEIVARRNILVHNGGRVDRKYLREVKGTPAKLKERLPLPPTYLRAALALMEGLAASATRLALENIYGDKAQGKLALSLHSFDRRRGNPWGVQLHPDVA